MTVAAGTAAALPDGRAHEMVSPAEKSGADVLSLSSRTRASVDGNAIAFASFVAFGDPDGTGVGVDYISERSDNGWLTHPITPRQDSQPLWATAFQHAGNPASYEEFSPDLTKGIVRAISPITDAPNVEKVANLYARDDLRNPNGGAYRLLTDSVNPLSFTGPFGLAASLPFAAGASADFSHVIFESYRSLTADAPPECASLTDCFPKLYEWVDGTVRLAGVLPDGTAAEGSIAGLSASGPLLPEYTPNAISRDGSRIFFTSPVNHAPAGSPTPTPDSQAYLRIDGTTTVRINASEKATADVTQGARWQSATPDGLEAFFTTEESLVEEDTDDSGDLYMYDASRPDGDPDNLTLLSFDDELADGHEVEGVLGASDDASYVYFVSLGQLEEGQPLLPNADYGVYVWHEGTVRFIGDIGGGAIDMTENVSYGSGYTQYPKTSRVTPTGRHLVFTTFSGQYLTGYDHGECFGASGCRQVYVYDATANDGAGELSCASCNPSGSPATVHADVNVEANIVGAWIGKLQSRALSDDGRRVFFSTGEALVPEDVNGARVDAYEYDTATGETHLLSSGTSPTDSYFMDASPSGDDAFILTRERLVGWDVDDSADLYDARVGGGFPEPAPDAPPCTSDACRGPGGSGRAGTDIGSATVYGDGNLEEGVSFRLLAITERQQRRWARTGAAYVGVRVPGAGEVRLKVRARLGGARRIVARASRRTTRARTLRLRLQLSPAARGALSRGKRLRLTIVARYEKAPPSGTAKQLRRSVTLTGVSGTARRGQR